jgi:ribosome-associated protein
MEDMLNDSVVIAVAKLLEDNKAQNVEVINVSGLCSWGEYIIIATGTSETHIRGLKSEVKKLVLQSGDDIRNTPHHDDTEGWVLFDCGDYIINLMDQESRSFYDLEQRWSDAQVIYQSSIES